MKQYPLLIGLLLVSFGKIYAQVAKPTNSISCCSCRPCKNFNSEADFNKHVCAVHKIGCPTKTVLNNDSKEDLQQIKQEEAEKRTREEAEAKSRKEEAEKIQRENKQALERMKGSSSKNFEIKTSVPANPQLKGEKKPSFGLKNAGQNEINDPLINDNISQLIRKDSIHYLSQLQQLMIEADHIKVPSPPKPKIIHEGIILGLFNTREINAVKKITSPFTGKPYKEDEFFATSDSVSAKELLRGVIDNGYLGEWTLNTAWGKKLLASLDGTHFDRLIAHSNGATVSEALIRKGIITVDELNVVGGDRSLINYFGFNELIASGKVKRVIVWVNPADIIPYGTCAGLFSTPVTGVQYSKTISGYFIRKLSGQNEGGEAKVEYRFLKGSQYEGQVPEVTNVFAAHGLDAYSRNMIRYFQTTK